MTLGDVIRQYREEHGLSQAQFADLAQISKGYISMLENNKNPASGRPLAPTSKMFQSVARVLGCSLSDLMDMMDDAQAVDLLDIQDSGPARPVIDGEAVSDDEEDLIRRYRDLSAAGRGRLRDYLDDLLQIYKNIASDGSLSDADSVG